MKKIVLNSIFSLANFAYPFLLWFFKDEYFIQILLFMAILWGAKWFLERKIYQISLCLFFIVLSFIKSDFLLYVYPVMMNAAFFAFFASSLESEPVITKIAKLQAQKNNEILDEKAIKYTKNLTIIWCAFFVFNGLVCFVLALFEDKIFWTFYTGLVSYILIGVLFLGELIFRKGVIHAKNNKR